MKKVAFLFVTASMLVGALVACGGDKPAATANDVTNSASSAATGAATTVSTTTTNVTTTATNAVPVTTPAPKK